MAMFHSDIQFYTIQIYDGHSIHSRLMTLESSQSEIKSGQVMATTFQLLVKVTSIRTDGDFRFDATYRVQGKLDVHHVWGDEFPAVE